MLFPPQFVFRQGSPLDPAALRLVAVPDARAVVVCTDYSKSSKDGDAQVGCIVCIQVKIAIARHDGSLFFPGNGCGFRLRAGPSRLGSAQPAQLPTLPFARVPRPGALRKHRLGPTLLLPCCATPALGSQ